VTGVGLCGCGTKRKLNVSLGQYTTVFHAKVYAILVSVSENVDRDLKNRNIYILLRIKPQTKSA
jgi:hypothetical protein